jgi:hypothetical protein
MHDRTTSPFRAAALQKYVHTRATPTQLVGLTTRRIALIWVLLALCAAGAVAVLLALKPLASP